MRCFPALLSIKSSTIQSTLIILTTVKLRVVVNNVQFYYIISEQFCQYVQIFDIILYRHRINYTISVDKFNLKLLSNYDTIVIAKTFGGVLWNIPSLKKN